MRLRALLPWLLLCAGCLPLPPPPPDAPPGDDDTAGPSDRDDDGDGFTEDQGDCDDDDPDNFPTNTEVCDGADNDCRDGADFEGEDRDEDQDGAVACEDCDDDDASSTVVADDADCDGTITADDCDDDEAGVRGIGDQNISPASMQSMTFVSLCAGSFEMGCTPAQDAREWCQADEFPAHTVSLTRHVWISETEVTQEQWGRLFQNNPSSPGLCGEDCLSSPVSYVNWWEAARFANALSEHEELEPCYVLEGCGIHPPGTGFQCAGATVGPDTESVYECTGYRLPTEAEWEYAARAGADSLYAGGNTPAQVAWYSENAQNMVHEVALQSANDWGLHDMSGNVSEWVWDWFVGTYYERGSQADPEGPEEGAVRGSRGGDFTETESDMRVSRRKRFDPGHRHGAQGFRLARTMTIPAP